MKQFKEYLKEGAEAKKYQFRVKIAGDVAKESEAKLESLLGKWSVNAFKKSSTTPVQQLPLDFPTLKNTEVNIYEVTLDYPTTSNELTEYLSSNLKIARENFVVRRPSEPSEEYQEHPMKADGALLTDNEYKEAPNANADDFYGEKYNSAFLKELNDVLRLQRKERGEEIPTEGTAKYVTDLAQNNKSPIQQAQDPRK